MFGFAKISTLVLSLLLVILPVQGFAPKYVDEMVKDYLSKYVSGQVGNIAGLALVKAAGSLIKGVGKSHCDMTGDALSQVAKNYFGVSTLTSNMKAAFSDVCDGNAAVDEDQSRAELHFDGEALPEGQARLLDLASQVVTALQANQISQARTLLGNGLHTLQDFYAHSNWVELGNTDIHPDLGVDGKTLSRLDADVPTCQNCTYVTPNPLRGFEGWCNICGNNVLSSNGLSSGYYPNEDRKMPNNNKCSHGGPKNYLSPNAGGGGRSIDGINKDVRNCILSPHSNLHDTAASLATKASIKYVDGIRAKLTDTQLRSLFGVDASVSVLTSRALSSEVKRSLGFVESALSKRLDGTNDGTYMLRNGRSTIRARHFEDEKERRDDASGGALPGLSATVVATTRGQSVFIYANTGADISELDSLHFSTLAADQDIKIYVFLVGQLQTIDPDIYNMTQRTGGQVFSILSSEVNYTNAIISELTKDDSVDILSVATSGPRNFFLPIDITISDLSISLSGSTSLNITRPNGTVVSASDSDVVYQNLSNGAFITFASPEVGVWNISVSGGPYSLSVTAVSVLDFQFEFVELRGRPEHQGLLPLQSFPADGASVNAIATLSTNFMTASFSLLSKAGAVIQTGLPLTLTGIEGNATDQLSTFYTEEGLTLPDTSFLVVVYGIDNNGINFQRIRPVEFESSLIEISSPPDARITNGSWRNLTFLLYNRQNVSVTYNFTALDNFDYLYPNANQSTIDGGITSLISMSPNSTQVVTVGVHIHDATVGDTEFVTINIRGLSADNRTFTSHWNYGGLNLFVVNGTATNETRTWDGYVLDA